MKAKDKKKDMAKRIVVKNVGQKYDADDEKRQVPLALQRGKK